jgi:transcriptional regulator with XRE-family HTH domain
MYPNLKLQIFRLRVHQNQLAKVLGMNETVLSKVICGYREPSESQRKTLANYLGVDENWLFEKYEGVPADRAVNPVESRPSGTESKDTR